MQCRLQPDSGLFQHRRRLLLSQRHIRRERETGQWRHHQSQKHQPGDGHVHQVLSDSQHHAAAGKRLRVFGLQLGQECDGYEQRIPASRTRRREHFRHPEIVWHLQLGKGEHPESAEQHLLQPAQHHTVSVASGFLREFELFVAQPDQDAGQLDHQRGGPGGSLLR